MKKVLITGITGFAGSHLYDYLHTINNIEIFGTDFSNLKDHKSLQNVYTVNLVEKRTVEKLINDIRPDYLFHLAALASPAKSFIDPYLTFSNNIRAEINILEAIRKYQLLTKILIIGSGDEYGW